MGRWGKPDADVAASERDSSGNDVKDVHDDASEGSSVPAQEQEEIMEADEVVFCHQIGLKVEGGSIRYAKRSLRVSTIKHRGVQGSQSLHAEAFSARR